LEVCSQLLAVVLPRLSVDACRRLSLEGKVGFDAAADLGCRLGPDIGAGKKQDEQAAGEPNENARHIAPFVSADWDQMSQSRMAENPLIFQRNAAMLARRPPSVNEGMTQRLRARLTFTPL
jgi:hypothetical protein